MHALYRAVVRSIRAGVTCFLPCLTSVQLGQGSQLFFPFSNDVFCIENASSIAREQKTRRRRGALLPSRPLQSVKGTLEALSTHALGESPITCLHVISSTDSPERPASRSRIYTPTPRRHLSGIASSCYGRAWRHTSASMVDTRDNVPTTLG